MGGDGLRDEVPHEHDEPRAADRLRWALAEAARTPSEVAGP